MKWLDKLKGKKEEVVDELPLTSESIRRAALDKEKEEATKQKKAWVSVIDTQVNPDNIKNGFFELDWNNQFIEELLDAGYTGETNEEIVDGWFRTIVSQMLEEEGEDTSRGAGYIKVVPKEDDKEDIS